MALPNITFRGYAAIAGVVGTIDLVTIPSAQTGKVDAEWEQDETKNNKGFSVGIRARNFKRNAEFSFKVVGTTFANAATGSVFLAPLAVVTLSGFDAPEFNGVYLNMSGQSIDLGQSKDADMTIKLTRWTDADQNALLTSTPV